jgi:hypothetical protein
VTTSRATAQEWLTEWTAVGVEGLVIKGVDQTCQPGRRGWLKYRTRNSAEAIVGAVTGSLTRPETVLLGRYTSDGHFLLVARSTPLSPRLRAELGGGLLAPRARTTPGTTCTSVRTGAVANCSGSLPSHPCSWVSFTVTPLLIAVAGATPSTCTGSASTSPPTTSRSTARKDLPTPIGGQQQRNHDAGLRQRRAGGVSLTDVVSRATVAAHCITRYCSRTEVRSRFSVYFARK